MSAPVNAADQGERELFEVAARARHPNMYFDLRADGEYRSGLARDLWPIWQVARRPAAQGQALSDAEIVALFEGAGVGFAYWDQSKRTLTRGSIDVVNLIAAVRAIEARITNKNKPT